MGRLTNKPVAPSPTFGLVVWKGGCIDACDSIHGVCTIHSSERTSFAVPKPRPRSGRRPSATKRHIALELPLRLRRTLRKRRTVRATTAAVQAFLLILRVRGGAL